MYLFTKSLWYLPFLSIALFGQQNIALDSIFQDTPTKQLEEVVVSDSRFDLKRSQSGKPIIKIDSETISNFQGLGLSSILKRYAGVEILGTQSYAGQNKTVSLRGGRNRQVLILIDGIRVSDPSRIDNDYNINFLSLDQIESIEILKGASSSLYGSSAATGVINIKTNKARSGFNTSIQSVLGSESDQNTKRGLNLFKNAIQINHGGKKMSAKGYVSSHRSDGMSAVIGNEKDPFSHTNFGASLMYKSGYNFNFNLGYDGSEINTAYDNSFPLEDAAFQLVTTMDRFYFNPSYKYKNGGATMQVGYQKVNRDFKSDYPFETEAENTQVEVFNKYAFGDRFFTVLGGLFQHNYANYDANQSTKQNDVFVNVVIIPSTSFRINMGGRLNSHSTYGTNFTYSINPSFELVNNQKLSVKLLTALSSAFIAPSLYQLYDVYSGNADLRPEENKSFEAGFVVNRSGWEWIITHFKRKENPSLIYDMSTYRYENANEEASYTGIEVQFSGLITPKLKLHQNITFTETEKGDLRYLPKFSSQTEFSYNVSNQWFMSLRIQAIGKRFGLDNETVLHGYELVNFSLRHQVKEIPLIIFAHATNLFNTNYVEIEGYTTRGRNLIAGLSYSF
ncbi:MAG: vitamin B12 transporter [Flavobacteriaceae bacterium]|jgi:vitamin B12 transporter|tara:strand:+ start:5387 stop:7246 length:1860 start_codon:yes stop_codon:yes gene_type:complete